MAEYDQRLDRLKSGVDQQLEHIKILNGGASGWNEWRVLNPTAKPSLFGLKLAGMDLSGVNFSGLNLRRTILTHTKLHRANLSDADFKYADLSGADATEADLSRATLKQADLEQARFVKATLREVVAERANFHGADLRQAQLAGAELRGACLREAMLECAIITRANLVDADLTCARMTDATLAHSILGRTVFGCQDLSMTAGLDTVRHVFPSVIDIETLYQSGGKISEKFLRRAGVRSSIVEYKDALIAAEAPIQFHSCFISYSTANEAFAEQLYNDLQRHGIRCWFAPHDLQSGRKLYDQLKAGIQLQDRLVIILSEESITSTWVRTEILTAHKREVDENRAVLFPISMMPFGDLRQWECLMPIRVEMWPGL